MLGEQCLEFEMEFLCEGGIGLQGRRRLLYDMDCIFFSSVEKYDDIKEYSELCECFLSRRLGRDDTVLPNSLGLRFYRKTWVELSTVSESAIHLVWVQRCD